MAKSPDTSVKDAVYKLQLSLLDGIHYEKQLFAAGTLLSTSDYKDVVTERAIANLCGYPLCTNPLPLDDRPRKGRYRISLKEHKVYDLQETRLFCCSDCLIKSRAFLTTLKNERQSEFDWGNVYEVLRLFGDLSLEEKQNNLGKPNNSLVSELKITEKSGVKDGEASFENWIGPYNAIEGYVPRRESCTLPIKKKGTKPIQAQSEIDSINVGTKPIQAQSEIDSINVGNNMDFCSTIITGDQCNAPRKYQDSTKNNEMDFTSKVPIEGHNSGSEKLSVSKKGEISIGKTAQANKTKLNSYLDSEANPSSCREGIVSVSSLEYSGTNKTGEAEGSQLGDCLKLSGGHATLDSDSNGQIMSYLKSSEAKQIIDSSNKKAEVVGAQLKSSLKSSKVKTLNRNVTWADESKLENSGDSIVSKFSEIKNTFENFESLGTSDGEHESASLRLASAQACAFALSQAAEGVASGEFETMDAVSEAGIVILPSACEDDEGIVDVAEPDQSGIKWPKKPVLLDTDAFDAEDSWHDTPPEGFSLTLSSFATMWMTLIGWVSSSSIAYIYGCDGSAENEFSHANGREYPRKTVWSGRSSEIKRTLAICFAQALPELASNLGIRTPISTLENAMGGLLETMSFCEALPPFNRKQWHVILLLFLDAFCVCRIPSITRHMTNIRTRMQKVLEGAQVTREEYEIMKDLLIPLGRVPEFSVLSGG